MTLRGSFMKLFKNSTDLANRIDLVQTAGLGLHCLLQQYPSGISYIHSMLA